MGLSLSGDHIVVLVIRGRNNCKIPFNHKRSVFIRCSFSEADAVLQRLPVFEILELIRLFGPTYEKGRVTGRTHNVKKLDPDQIMCTTRSVQTN
jgi:hypothetical protein